MTRCLFAFACKRWGIARWLLTLCLALIPAGVLWAHGGGAPQLTSEPAGPYLVYAWSEPEPWRVGEVHLSMLVTRPNEEAQATQVEVPVTDADISVTYTPVDGAAGPMQVDAVRQEYLNNYYFEADTMLPEEGAWRITLNISGTQGDGSTEFTMTAQPAQTVNWMLVGSAGAVLLLGIALAGVWSRKQEPAQSGSEARPSGSRRRRASQGRRRSQKTETTAQAPTRKE